MILAISPYLVDRVLACLLLVAGFACLLLDRRSQP